MLPNSRAETLATDFNIWAFSSPSNHRFSLSQSHESVTRVLLSPAFTRVTTLQGRTVQLTFAHNTHLPTSHNRHP
jgi:hypothetical protein